MENEIMTNEEIEVVDEMEIYEDSAFDRSASTGKILLAIGAGLVGAGIAAFKNRAKLKDKITAGQIKRLEKKGFAVYSTTDDETEACDVNDVYTEDMDS